MGDKKYAALFHCSVLLGLLLVAPALVQAEQLPIKKYTTADGLAHDQINRIVQDSHGFLWFCTAGGLSRFDGYKFTNYTTDQGLSHPVVNDLLETRDGIYWVATGNGVCRFNPIGSSTPNEQALQKKVGPTISEPMFIAYHPEGSKAAQSINALKEDHAGGIWCGTGGGLYRLEQAGHQVEFRYVDIGLSTKTLEDTTVFAILEDRRGMLWIGAESGLYRRLPDGRAERYTVQHCLPANKVMALLEDREGQLWAGATVGLCRIVLEPDMERPIVARVYGKKDGMPISWITSLFQASDSKLWIGGGGGMSEYIPAADKAGPIFRTYTTAQGLSDRECLTFAEDWNGNLWIGTESGGAMKIARNGFTTYTLADGLSYLRIASILEDRTGTLCVIGGGGEELLIDLFDGERFGAVRPNLPKNATMSWGWYQNCFQDREDEWWISTSKGICRFPKIKESEQLARASPTIYTSKDGLIGDYVFRAFEDSHGAVWISTVAPFHDSMVKWDRAAQTFHRYSTADGIPQAPPTAFREDATGDLWIGFYLGGLARYRNGRFTLFTAADGVPAGLVLGLYLDRAGRLWAATGSGGLCRIDDPGAEHPRFVAYTTKEGLSSNWVTCVTEDQWGRIYIGTNNGLDRLDPSTGRIKHYTVADGLANNFVNVSFRDHDGALWFGTLQGLSRFVPEPNRPASPPPVFIGGLQVAGTRHRISELGVTDLSDLEFGANQNSVQIDFFGLGFGMGETLRYQYKLEGASSDWSAPIDGRTVNYENLSPGDYRFMVRAVNSEGLTSATPAMVNFRILPPLWRRWWFLTLAGALLGSILYSIDRYRIARLIELERVRTRIATDLHDDIGSSLSQIAMLSEVTRSNLERGNRVLEPLLKIADLSRDLVDSMNDIVWAANPKKDRLSDLTQRMRRFAGDLFTSRDIEFDLRVPEPQQDMRMGAEMRRELFLIFKEGVNNIARHSECKRVEIKFLIGSGRLELSLRDDGKGFDPGRVNNGNGLASMRQRAMKMGGMLDILSSEGQGTLVILKAPLGRHAR